MQKTSHTTHEYMYVLTLCVHVYMRVTDVYKRTSFAQVHFMHVYQCVSTSVLCL